MLFTMTSILNDQSLSSNSQRLGSRNKVTTVSMFSGTTHKTQQVWALSPESTSRWHYKPTINVHQSSIDSNSQSKSHIQINVTRWNPKGPAINGYAVTLRFDLLTPKANQHIYEAKHICPELVKFISLVFKIWYSQGFQIIACCDLDLWPQNLISTSMNPNTSQHMDQVWSTAPRASIWDVFKFYIICVNPARSKPW